MNRGDHETHRHADVDQHRLRELQARLDRLRHRVGYAELVERVSVVCVAGAGDEGHVAAQPARRLDHQFVGSRRIHRHHHRPRGFDAAAAQVAGARRVSVIDRLAGLAGPRDQPDVRIDGDERDLVDVEHVADQRADPAVADDDDAALVAFGRRLLRRRVGARARAGVDQRAELCERRNGEHRDRDGADQRHRQGAVDQSAGEGRADHHEAEFAPRSEQQRHFRPDPRRQAECARQPEEDQGLEADQRGGETENAPRLGDDQRRIDSGPDGDEIEPEQQALERLDGHLDLASVLGFRQQEPGDERAERHRQPARRGGEAVAEHHQQTGGHEEFRALRFGDEMEKRPQREPAEHDQRGERKRGGNEPADQRRAEPAACVARESPDHDEQRRDGEILEEQHREARPPDRRAEPLAFDENRYDDCGRGHGERAADRRRRGRLQAERPGDARSGPAWWRRPATARGRTPAGACASSVRTIVRAPW